jgi:hypothetical protein
MQKQVDVIAQEHFSLEENNPTKDFKKGKRDDHDDLPDDIQALYVENLSIVQRMREVHLKLRSLSTEDSTCPDSERYPFLKELIDLDKRLHSNWEQYDHYVGTQSEFPKDEKKATKTKKKTAMIPYWGAYQCWRKCIILKMQKWQLTGINRTTTATNLPAVFP